MSTRDASTPYAQSVPFASSPKVGTVKWFNDTKGFGFLVADDGTNCFAHFSSITGQAGRRTLLEGQRVSFDEVMGSKGPAALNVRVIE